MLEFCGYNFMFDKNAMDILPTSLDNIKNVKIQNGIFDHFNLTRDVTSSYSIEVPTEWDFYTLMDCNFKNTTNAGNIDLTIDQVTSIKLKRREKGTFEWITLYDIPINSTEDFSFSKNDFLNKNNQEYEYAFVPILNGIEGDYILNSVKSEFDGIFICDYKSIFKFYNGLSYGSKESVQSVSTYETIGNKYPIVVSNSVLDYDKGSVSATLLNPDFEETRRINRKAIVEYQNLITKFLKNKRAKILKDWNGNIWLILITSSPNITYKDNYGMGIVDVSFDWVEQGDVNNQSDLYRNGFTEVLE